MVREWRNQPRGHRGGVPHWVYRIAPARLLRAGEISGISALVEEHGSASIDEGHRTPAALKTRGALSAPRVSTQQNPILRGRASSSALTRGQVI